MRSSENKSAAQPFSTATALVFGMALSTNMSTKFMSLSTNMSTKFISHSGCPPPTVALSPQILSIRTYPNASCSWCMRRLGEPCGASRASHRQGRMVHECILAQKDRIPCHVGVEPVHGRGNVIPHAKKRTIPQSSGILVSNLSCLLSCNVSC